MAQHPCFMHDTYKGTTATCLYCCRPSFPGFHCSKCRMYMCLKCHDKLRNKTCYKEWRAELSLVRDEILQKVCVRQREELKLLSGVMCINDLSFLISEYSKDLHIKCRLGSAAVLWWFSFYFPEVTGCNRSFEMWMDKFLASNERMELLKNTWNELSLGQIVLDWSA